MQWLVAGLLTGLVQIVGTLVGRVLVSLGVALVTYAGMDFTVGYLKTQALAAIGGLPPEVVGMLSVLKVGVALNIIFSAFMVRLTIQGLTGDGIKKWVVK